MRPPLRFPIALVALLAPLAACEPPPLDVSLSGRAVLCGVEETGCVAGPLGDLGLVEGLSELDVRDAPGWDADLGQIDSARVTSLELRVAEPEGDLRWLDAVAFFALQDGEAVKLAERDLGPAEQAGRRLSLEVTGADLATALKAGPLLVTTEASGRQPDVRTTVEISGVLSITFGL